MPGLTDSMGELQTLLATFQQTNQQLGQIVKALTSVAALSNQTSAQILGFANDAAAAAGGVQIGFIYVNTATTPWSLAVRHV